MWIQVVSVRIFPDIHLRVSGKTRLSPRLTHDFSDTLLPT